MSFKKDKSTRQLIGVNTFGKYGLITYAKGELAFFKVAPTNISVLSQTNIQTKIRHLTIVLSSLSDLEIVCMDSSECFDDNKNYLNRRIEEENKPAILKLLKKDIGFLDQIQIEMATARDFMFISRFRDISDENIFNAVNRTEKIIKEQGFETLRASQDDIKRMLAIYFEQNVASDYDNERWLRANAIIIQEETANTRTDHRE